MPYRAEESSFHKKTQVSNFGKTERINGLKWFTFINVDIDDQMDWTIVFDTKSMTYVPLRDPKSGTLFQIPAGRVLAKVEYGSGNGYTETIWDVTDLCAIPIAGNHIKVALTLVSTDDPMVGAPPEAAALVSAFLSADFAQGAFPSAVDHHNVFPFATGASVLAAAQTVSAAPVRLNGLSAFNPQNSNAYLFFVSNPDTAIPLGAVPVPQRVKKIFVLPPNQQVVYNFAASVPFDRGLCWFAASSLVWPPVGALDVRVDLELVRRPTVKIVEAIAPTG